MNVVCADDVDELVCAHLHGLVPLLPCAEQMSVGGC
jgi:hypothetical protein